MNIDAETGKKIQELQFLEQTLQGFLVQKQSVQIELNESTNAIDELKKTDDEAYKIIGGIMLKADKQKLLKEMEEKKKLLDLRINSVEKQEKLIEGKAEKLRNEINDAITKKK